MNFEKAMYSINKGIWGTSVGGKETLKSLGMLPEAAWPTQVSKSNSEEVSLYFEKGELKKVNERVSLIRRMQFIICRQLLAPMELAVIFTSVIRSLE